LALSYFFNLAQLQRPGRVKMEMHRPGQRSGFTLIELLVSISILAILAAISYPVYTTALQHAHCSTCASNMHSLSIALMSYAYENNGQLPGRAQSGTNKWPLLLLPYCGGDPSVYIDPGDPVAVKVSMSSMLSNTKNNSSFFFNGFNDLGSYTDPTISVSLYDVPSSSALALLGEQEPGSDQFYMDFVEGNQDDILNKTSYFGGSNYAFADGSVRYIKVADYSDSMWLVNPNYVIPPVPPGH